MSVFHRCVTLCLSQGGVSVLSYGDRMILPSDTGEKEIRYPSRIRRLTREVESGTFLSATESLRLAPSSQAEREYAGGIWAGLSSRASSSVEGSINPDIRACGGRVRVRSWRKRSILRFAATLGTLHACRISTYVAQGMSCRVDGRDALRARGDETG